MKSIWNKKYTILSILYIISLWYISSRPLPDMKTDFELYDKILHFLAFSLMTLLVYMSMVELKFGRSSFVWAFAFCLAYAGIDELHQAFVTSRNSSILDFIADFVGISMMSLVIQIQSRKLGIKSLKK